MTQGAGGFGLTRPGRGAHQADRQRDGPRSARRCRHGHRAASSMEPSGLIRFNDLRLAAPALRVTLGRRHLPAERRDRLPRRRRQPRLRPARGPRHRHGDARRMSSSQAASPGFGIGLRDIRAVVRATPEGWAVAGERPIAATGRSRADVVDPVQPRADDDPGQPADLRRHRLHAAGSCAAAAGPFAGHADLHRAGPAAAPSGSPPPAATSASTSTADANGARTPGDTPIIVQRGIIQATVILYPTRPHDRRAMPSSPGSPAGDLYRPARAHPRRSSAAAAAGRSCFAEGRRGVPFRVAANAPSRPITIRAAAAGAGQQHPLPHRPAGRDRARGAAAGDSRRRRSPCRRARSGLAGRLRQRHRHPVAARRASTSRCSTPSRPASASAARLPAASISRAAGGALPARRGAAQHRRLHPHRHRRPLHAGRTSRSPAALQARGRRLGRDHPARRRGDRPGAGAAAAARARAPAAGRRGCWRRRSPAASAITARPTCRCRSPTCPATSSPGRSASPPISRAGCRRRNSPACVRRRPI